MRAIGILRQAALWLACIGMSVGGISLWRFASRHARDEYDFWIAYRISNYYMDYSGFPTTVRTLMGYVSEKNPEFQEPSALATYERNVSRRFELKDVAPADFLLGKCDLVWFSDGDRRRQEGVNALIRERVKYSLPYLKDMAAACREQDLDDDVRCMAIKRLMENTDGSVTCSIYDPDVEEGTRLRRNTLLAVSCETNGMVAVTALQALLFLASADPLVDMNLVERIIADHVIDTSAPQSSRMEAIRLCEDLGTVPLQRVLMRLANDSSEQDAIRQSASNFLHAIERKKDCRR